MSTIQDRLDKIEEMMEKLLNSMSPAEMTPEQQELAQKYERLLDAIESGRLDEDILGRIEEKLDYYIQEKHDLSEADPAFNKKRNFHVVMLFGIAVIFAVISIHWVLPLVPFAFGILTTTIGALFKIWYDKVFYIGDTIGKQAKNAVAYAIGGLEFAIYFGVGFILGYSYITNPMGGDNETGPKTYIERPAAATIQEEPRQQLDTTSRGNGTVLPERAGKPTREQ